MMANNREVSVKKEALGDGLELFVACGPAFRFRKGVVYGSTIKYLDVIHNRSWTEAEAQNYPCA